METVGEEGNVAEIGFLFPDFCKQSHEKVSLWFSFESLKTKPEIETLPL
ncbi:MAG: hypothetical protein J7540_13960 [Roseofilum sp. SID2]|nr:hypothetical protein [Roseofilum sp. SID2]